MNHGRLFRIGGVVMAAICLAGIMASGAQAFDGNRRGFFLGGGIGPALTTFTQTLSDGYISATSDRLNKASLFTEFRIGYAPADNYQIYYFNHVTWLGLENAYGNNVTIANGVGGVGMTYFMEPKAPSSFFSVGLGLSTWDAIFEEGSDAWSGFGLMFGGGYEFSRHISFEGTLLYGNPGKEQYGIKANTNALVLGARIVFTAY